MYDILRHYYDLMECVHVKYKDNYFKIYLFYNFVFSREMQPLLASEMCVINIIIFNENICITIIIMMLLNKSIVHVFNSLSLFFNFYLYNYYIILFINDSMKNKNLYFILSFQLSLLMSDSMCITTTTFKI